MTEQPTNAKEVPTPGPWRWGFWKYDRASHEYEFRPASEEDAGLGGDELILSTAQYGERRGDPRSTEPGTVLCPMSCGYGGETTICVGDADMALIAAAPETAAQRDDLLAACAEAVEELERLKDVADAAEGWVEQDVIDACRAAIAQAKETDD